MTDDSPRLIERPVATAGETSPAPGMPPLATERDVVFRSRDVNVYYGTFRAVRDITFDVRKNEIIALIGPSGCGKSTVLRCYNRMNDLIKDARVTGSITYRGAAPIRGSRLHLESALFNLLDNAVKFSEPGGRVDVGVETDQRILKVWVADDGIGIPAAERSRIFERFYRVDRARSRHTGGTGLGLSIVRHVALNHGGEVSVTSREGYGAQFTLTLPLDDGA